MRTDPEIELNAMQMSEDEFTGTYDHPFLAIKVELDDEGAEFQTIASTDFNPSMTEQALLPVMKRPGANGFSFITVGRAQNNDIVIAVNSVSKCHAFINKKPDRFMISDAGSKNGTQLNGRMVNRHDPAEIRTGDKVTFSPRVTATFMDARAAHAWLRSHPMYR